MVKVPLFSRLRLLIVSGFVFSLLPGQARGQLPPALQLIQTSPSTATLRVTAGEAIQSGTAAIGYDPALVLPVSVTPGADLPPGSTTSLDLASTASCPVDPALAAGLLVRFTSPGGPTPPGRHDLLQIRFAFPSGLQAASCSHLRFSGCLELAGAPVVTHLSGAGGDLPAPDTRDLEFCLRADPPADNDSLRFDGQRRGASVDNPMVHAGQTFTFESWVRAGDVPSCSRTFYHRAFDGDRSLGVCFLPDGKTDAAFSMGVATPSGVLIRSARAEVDYKPGDWLHLAGSYDGDSLRLYLNGKLAAEVSAPEYNGYLSWTQNYLGTYIGTNLREEEPPYFAGEIDEVRAWTVARSEEEIAGSMHRRIREPEAGLAAVYGFDEGSGQEVRNLVAGDQHGFLGVDPAADSFDPERVKSTAPLDADTPASVPPDWKLEPFLKDLDHPMAVSFDALGRLYYALGSGEVFRAEPGGGSTRLTDLNGDASLSFTLQYQPLENRFYAASHFSKGIWTLELDGSSGVFQENLPDCAHNIVFDSSGTGYTGAYFSGGIQRIPAGGLPQKLLPGIASDAVGLSFGPGGNLYLGSRATNQIIRIDPATLDHSVFANVPGGPEFTLWLSDGTAVVNCLLSGEIRLVAADGGSSRPLASGLQFPRMPVLGPDGAIYFPETESTTIYRLIGASGTSPNQARAIQTGPGTASVRVRHADPIQGGEVGIGYDPTQVVPLFASRGPDLPLGAKTYLRLDSGANCGEGAPVAAGLIVGWINSAQGDAFTPPGEQDLVRISFGLAEGAPVGSCTDLSFVQCLGPGVAPVRNIVTGADGSSIPLQTFSSRFCRNADPPFRRGDANQDGNFDISDGIVVLGCLFLNEGCRACSDASDANDDGQVDITDAVYLFSWRFLDGPEPLPPFPACGQDPSLDRLDPCDKFQSCP
jgi:hypothetical protein